MALVLRSFNAARFPHLNAARLFQSASPSLLLIRLLVFFSTEALDVASKNLVA